MKIMIDAGHGIDTPGKRSPDGQFREYLWNRQVTDKLLDLLHETSWAADAAAVVTETNDISLQTRVNRVNAVCNQVGANNVILLSIHANAAGAHGEWCSAKGWSCYTTRGETKSDNLAECLYMAFEQAFKDRKIRKDLSDGDSDIEADFYIIRKTKCPAVLIENFFYDNKEECQWLLKEETKDRIAKAIFEGIKLYLGQMNI